MRMRPLIIAVLLLAGCGAPPASCPPGTKTIQEPPTTTPSHTAIATQIENAADRQLEPRQTGPSAVSGRAPSRTLQFAGTLPCQACSGLQMRLDLGFDEQGKPAGFQLEQTYHGTPDGDRYFITVGAWTIGAGANGKPDATVFTLHGNDGSTQRWLVADEQHLHMLDATGVEPDSRLNYALETVKSVAP